jgi:7-keto-8-aminopelargonate synthetase-like enzyme
MDGSCADLEKLVELKNKYDAILIVDEAHAIGCMGKTGAGLTEQLNLTDDIEVTVAPLGKAVGATGAVIASKKPVIDYLINKARPFIYTTAPSPANCAAILAAMKIINAEPQRRIDLAANADYLRSQLNNAGFDTAASQTHIIPVIIGDSKKTVRISAELFAKGFYAAAIRPPTVENGTSRLRLSLQSSHTKAQIDAFVNALIESVK